MVVFGTRIRKWQSRPKVRTNMLKKCSTRQSCIFPKWHSFKIGTLVQCTESTFGPAWSCNYKKLKVPTSYSPIIIRGLENCPLCKIVNCTSWHFATFINFSPSKVEFCRRALYKVAFNKEWELPTIWQYQLSSL